MSRLRLVAGCAALLVAAVCIFRGTSTERRSEPPPPPTHAAVR
jgi:hypothetical protein